MKDKTTESLNEIFHVESELVDEKKPSLRR